MNKSVLLLLLLVFVVGCRMSAPAPRFAPSKRGAPDTQTNDRHIKQYNSDISNLLVYAETNLWNLPPDAAESISVIADRRVRPRPFQFAYVCTIRHTNGLDYVVLVEANQSYAVPGDAPVRISVCSTNAADMGDSSEFSVGYRTQITGFSVLRSSDLNTMSDFLVVDVVTGCWHQTQKERQYYAFQTNDRYNFDFDGRSYTLVQPALVRQETDSGKPTRRLYPHRSGYDPTLRYFGINDPVYSALGSESKAEVLRALIYLTGIHDWTNGQQAEFCRGTLFQILEFGKAHRLREHEDPWIRDYAELLISVAKDERANTNLDHIPEVQ